MQRITKKEKKELTKQAYDIYSSDYRGDFPTTRVDRESKAYIKDYWAPFLQFDYIWYTGFIELTMAKISIMRLQIEREDFEDKDDTLARMDEMLNLGKKLVDNIVYYDRWLQWVKENSRDYVKISLFSTEKKGNLNAPVFTPLVTLYDCTLMDEYKEESVINEWIKENNYDKKDLQFSFGSEWNNGNTDKENEKLSQKLYKECAKEFKKDKDKYFKLLSKYYVDFSDYRQ